MGDPQWHAGVDPVSVETYLGSCSRARILLGMENLLCGGFAAVYSVACLER